MRVNTPRTLYRAKWDREKQRAHTDFLLEGEDLGTSLLLGPGKSLGKQIKMLFPC
jgi:hypothetical protein